MSSLDVLVFVAFLGLLAWDGVRHARRRESADDYLLAGRRVPWWALGLSVLATQASAITLVGTVGKGFEDGTRFVQFYYAMPIALIFIAIWVLPRFHRARVHTAYEWLGRRFDRPTGRLAAMTFLTLRTLSLGAVLYAPSTMLHVLLGLPQVVGILGLGVIAIGYTTLGGLGAVIATDVKQMVVMTLGLIGAFVVLAMRLPDGVSLAGGLDVAAATGRVELIDLRFDPNERYTIWSALLGGTFLFLAYFGTDQSQVQRYFAGRNLSQQRRGLMLTAVTKIPFQLAILLLGVLLFTDAFLLGGPLLHRDPEIPAATAEAEAQHAERRLAAARRYLAARGEERDVAGERLRTLAREREDLVARARREQQTTDDAGASEANFVFPRFVRDRFPMGLVGLFLAAVFAAALSSVDSELNALATVFTLDVMEVDPEGPADAVVRATRMATAGFGVFATVFALSLGDGGPLIEQVNRIGSFFYGALLGAFLLGWFSRVGGLGARAGLLAGIAAAAAVYWRGGPWLFMNTAGVGAAVVVGWTLDRVLGRDGGTS